MKPLPSLNIYELHHNFFSVHVPTLSSVSILFCLLVEETILPIAYFIPCLHALSHALLVAGIQNMMIDLSMDGRQTAWNCGVDISKGAESIKSGFIGLGHGRKQSDGAKTVSLVGGASKRSSICTSIMPSP